MTLSLDQNWTWIAPNALCQTDSVVSGAVSCIVSVWWNEGGLPLFVCPCVDSLSQQPSERRTAAQKSATATAAAAIVPMHLRMPRRLTAVCGQTQPSLRLVLPANDPRPHSGARTQRQRHWVHPHDLRRRIEATRRKTAQLLSFFQFAVPSLRYTLTNIETSPR